ncbi:MAG: DUF4276 family protein [Terriglobales bacterium]
MVRVYAVVEGQSEEAFIKSVLAPTFHLRGTFITPILLKKTGGDPRWARARGDVIRLLKQDQRAYVTTMFDLYALGQDWPGRPPSPIIDGVNAAESIEAACLNSVAAEMGDDLCVVKRFFPHVQPYEFEALLFSNPLALASSLRAPNAAGHLQSVRQAFPTPEQINDSPQTAPSKRIEQIVGRYDKVLYAAVAGASVGIETMRIECAHFRAWLERLEALPRT